MNNQADTNTEINTDAQTDAVLNDFTSLSISSEVIKAVEEMGYKEATMIQQRAIPHILAGRDVIGHSQTGTGKTAAFGIPAIERVAEGGGIQVLTLCPTRELAMQCAAEMRKFAKYKNLRILPIYGGQSIDLQINALKGGCHVIIGTPGRVMDHMRRKTLKFNNLKMLILDEADEMLNMGFREDIETILDDIPEVHQTLLFSATMSPEILAITRRYQTDPVMVKAVQKSLTVSTIKQYMYDIPRGAKLTVLKRLIDFYNPKRSMIFCNTKKMVDQLTEELRHGGYSAEALHGDMKQFARTQVMESFKRGRTNMLIATDVAARGLDIDHVQYVINYDLPQDLEYYIHRIGRTGRIGREGTSLTLISGTKEYMDIKAIEKHTKGTIELAPIPTLKEVDEAKIRRTSQLIMTTLDKGVLDKHRDIVAKLAVEDIDPIDLGAALLKMLYPSDKDYNPNLADDIKRDEAKIWRMRKRNDMQKQQSNLRPGQKPRTQLPFGAKLPFKLGGKANRAKLMLNLGSSDKLSTGAIVGAIAGEANIPGKLIGGIEIFENHAYVEVPKELVNTIISAVNGIRIRSRRVKIEEVRNKK